MMPDQLQGRQRAAPGAP